MILVYLLQVLNGIVTSLWVALVFSAIWGIACGIYALIQFDEITYTKRYVGDEKRREELLTKHQNNQKKRVANGKAKYISLLHTRLFVGANT